ncbi:MAG TPA: NAD-binding protein, partial [Pseudomonas sp.]|nr:NAD-binding protein [Pseudomonas sp.]
ASAGGDSVHYGDSRRGELLEAVGVKRARLLVVAVDKSDVALHIVQQARQRCAELPILVRTHDDSQLTELQAAGATEVVPEVLESSLMLASHALGMLGVAEHQVQQHMDEVRRSRYRLIHSYYRGAQTDLREKTRTLLQAVNLPTGAHACGRSLDELQLEAMGVEVQTLRRDGEELKLDVTTRLQEGDALVISGQLQDIEACEAHLLGGS